MCFYRAKVVKVEKAPLSLIQYVHSLTYREKMLTYVKAMAYRAYSSGRYTVESNEHQGNLVPYFETKKES